MKPIIVGAALAGLPLGHARSQAMPDEITAPVTITWYNCNLASAGNGAEATRHLIELFEAARMNGANHAHILWHIVVPNLRGTIASLAILVFISTWNEYLWPRLLTRSAQNSVVQIGLQMFITAEDAQRDPLMAASTLASLPILAIHLVLQRQVIASFMKSGLR